MPLPDDPDLRRFARWAWVIRLVGRLLARTVHRPDRLPDPQGRAVVMVANHRSLADVFFAIEALDHWEMRARCLVRQKFLTIPLFGRWLRSVGCIGAGDGSREAIADALDALAAGRPVAVMAEGRITPPDQRDELGLGTFRPGFVEIARKADAVVMPIAIVGSDEVWGSTAALPRVPWRGRPRVTITVGDLIVIDDMSDEFAVATSRAAIGEMIAAS